MTRPRWARILLAAVRLAAIYAVGVLILLLPLMLWSRRREFSPDGQPWLGLSMIGVVCFALGFVVLAAVKRLGFALLWGLLMWLWMAMIQGSPAPVFLDVPFLFWSAFAAPLYILSAIGLAENASARRWQFEVILTLLIWAIIAALAFFLVHPSGHVLRIRDPGPGFHFPTPLQGYLYAAWPFVIGARELGRVVVALWRSRTHASAA